MMMEKQFYVYILASRRNGTLYLGVTSDIVKRVWQHKNDLAEGFTRKYGNFSISSGSVIASKAKQSLAQTWLAMLRLSY